MRLELHPITPQTRLIKKVLDVFEGDGVLVYPTDSGYSLGCNAMSKKAVHKLYHLKRAIKKYMMALMVPDFSTVSDFARVDNFAFRYMRSLVPGPYTFLLPSTNRARKILDVNRMEVGIRMPQHPFLNALYEQGNNAVVLNSAAKINQDDAFIDPEDIDRVYGKLVDLIVDMGPLPITPTTVISLLGNTPELVRQGTGPLPEAGMAVSANPWD